MTRDTTVPISTIPEGETVEEERREVRKPERLFYFAGAIVCIEAIGLGMILPIMPELISTFGDVTIGIAAVYGGWLLFSYAGMQFLMSPVLGGLSDRFGRRPVLLVSLFAFALDFFLMAFAPSLIFLFLGRLIAGVCGATFAVSSAVVGDIYDEDKRAARFGILGAIQGLGFIIGPVLGGWLGEYGVRVPFFAAAGIALVNFVYGIFFFKETLAKSSRKAFQWTRANPIGCFVHLAGYAGILPIFIAILLSQLAFQTLPSVWAFFSIEQFAWSRIEIGTSIAAYGLMMAVVQGLLVGVLVPRIGPMKTCIIGLVGASIAYVGLSVVANETHVYPMLLIGSLFGLVLPALQSVLSKQIPASEQGEMQGGLASVLFFAAAVAPVAMSQVFNLSVSGTYFSYFPGGVYLLAAGLSVISIPVVLYAKRNIQYKVETQIAD